ncbi:heme transporter CcmA [Clostridium haemolyticum NCTC 8350]|uniref:Heme transporter CcmA n=2 Tax=Clostridium haemolyticum TaxID=84025 RepID=A0ABR4TBG7_CLOHA|nr:heme transporter CcmA [Clostridium haemolyticum NCTC 9693]KGM98699.1 heme transporter CcmA [Clostridium haemolyticum NCTC 8350]
MMKITNILISLSLFIFSILILIDFMIIGSDIPVNIHGNEVIFFIFLNAIYILLQMTYINYVKTLPRKLNIFLIMFVSFIWIILLINELIYSYHIYCRISEIIGLISQVYILVKYIKHV